MNQLSLQPDLGIEHVAELQAALLPHLDDEAPLQLAGDQVQRVHAAGLQLLHAFVRDRASAGRSTVVTLASPTLADAARALALAASLGVETPTGDPA
ncbi:MAG: STAS domain-containing protein [Lysobacter sp.]